jgi:hypothetical protein
MTKQTHLTEARERRQHEVKCIETHISKTFVSIIRTLS